MGTLAGSVKLIGLEVELPLRPGNLSQIGYCSNYVTANHAIANSLDHGVHFMTIAYVANLQNPNKQSLLSR